MKKLLCMLLVLILCVSVLISCNEAGGNNESKPAAESKPAESTPEQSDEPSTAPSDDPYTDEEGKYAPSEIKTFGNNEFSIIVRGAKYSTYQSDDFTTGSELYGETLDDAVVERNNYVENTYQVKLVIYKEDDFDAKIRAELNTGDHMYDLIMPTLPGLATLAQEGNLIDLNTLDNIDIDAPWYDKNATNTFSIDRKCFFTTGDITILNKVCTSSILFSKKMVKDNNLEDPYQLVRDKKWTYDTMKEMAKQVTNDTDGEPGMTGTDTWGLLAAYNDALTFYGAAGQYLCAKDAQDLPYLYLGKEQSSITVIQKILNDMAEKGTWVVYAQSYPDNIWVTSLNAFAEDRVLFRPSAFSATTKLRRNYDNANFGIIPLPLWNEEQDEYYSYCGTSETAGFGILNTAEDPEYSAYMLDAISAASKNIITPAYMELNLKGKDARDDESLEMLDIIFNSIRYDVGDVYNFGGIRTMFAGLVQSGSSDIVSTLEGQRSGIEDKIDEVIDAYDDLG